MLSEPLELILPASYGLNDIDQNHGKPEDYGHSPQRINLSTDALGSFTHSFTPVSYSRALWIIPPLGSFPRKPPAPLFYLRLLNTPEEYYAILVEETQVTYTLYQGILGEPKLKHQTKPAEITATLHKNRRGELRGWIANLTLQLTPSSARETLDPKKSSKPENAFSDK